MEAIKDGILVGTKKDRCERLKPYLQHQVALRENYSAYGFQLADQ